MACTLVTSRCDASSCSNAKSCSNIVRLRSPCDRATAFDPYSTFGDKFQALFSLEKKPPETVRNPRKPLEQLSSQSAVYLMVCLSLHFLVPGAIRLACATALSASLPVCSPEYNLQICARELEHGSAQQWCLVHAKHTCWPSAVVTKNR